MLGMSWQVRLWQVHDGIDWSVCEEFVVLPVLPIPLLSALDHAVPSPRCRLATVEGRARNGRIVADSTFTGAGLGCLPAAIWSELVGPFLLDGDVAQAMPASRAACQVGRADATSSSLPSWQCPI